MRTRAALLAVAAAALALASPEAALACAACISSAFGDRTYNWAYIGLLLMPFTLLGTIGGIIAWRAGCLHGPARRLFGHLTARLGRRPAPARTPIAKETT